MDALFQLSLSFPSVSLGHLLRRLIDAKKLGESAYRFLKLCVEAGNVEACYTLPMKKILMKREGEEEIDEPEIEDLLPRHYDEFICSLPFQEYTDPRAGILNLAVKLLMELKKNLAE
ncbi:hypothetical protein K1719_021755 [Acacia pycnantha]|nr:hypothetical protein K1719_021755 [Acacia pycnantha]